MRRVLITACAAIAAIIAVNFFYYRALYKKQTEYIVELLDRQVKIVGVTVDKTNQGFLSDLNQVASYYDDMSAFFKGGEEQRRSIERMRLFFSKYENFVTAIKFQDRDRNLFSLRRDEQTGEWLEQSIMLQQQPRIREKEELNVEAEVYQFYLPVLASQEGIAFGNIVVTVDYRKYFREIFTEFNLKDYQWQWVLTDSGDIIFDNSGIDIMYLSTTAIESGIGEGYAGDIIHRVLINKEERDIISSYYSTNLLQRDFGIVFSAPTEFFQKYILRNSLFIVSGTVLIILLIFYVFIRHIRSRDRDVEKLTASENMLVKLIEEMPAGVIIHGNNGKVILANNLAASVYGFWSGKEMTGSQLPSRAASPVQGLAEEGRNHAGKSDHLIRVSKEGRELTLLVSSIPFRFRGSDAVIEIHTDVSFLEEARQKEALASLGKTEYLHRLSFELRTPLMAVMGLSDLLCRLELPEKYGETVVSLRKAAEMLQGIADEILDLSEIESGTTGLEEVPVKIRQELNDCAGLAGLNLHKGGRLAIDIGDTVPESIISDPLRIRQILSNLLMFLASAASKGKINLACSSEKSSEGMLRLKFTLSGRCNGFAPEELERLFGDSVTLDSKVLREGGASGLGTIIAARLARIMGGSINAEFLPLAGGPGEIRISFSINTYSNDRDMKDIDVASVTSFDKVRTLVVTGSQRRDEELLGMLHRIGLALSVTSFTRTTINQVKANMNYADDTYKLLIVSEDSDLNAFDVVQQLWENNVTGRFIVMLICMNKNKGSLHRFVSMGIDHYLVRPVGQEDIASALRESFPFIGGGKEPVDMTMIRKDLKILVVEDNKMNQKVLVSMLATLGYGCDVAEDGSVALEKAGKVSYDLIFMDLLLPEIDGYEAAHKITENDKSVVIAAFTADNMPESRKKAELAGIIDYLSKPVRIDDIRNLLARHFETA